MFVEFVLKYTEITHRRCPTKLAPVVFGDRASNFRRRIPRPQFDLRYRSKGWPRTRRSSKYSRMTIKSFKTVLNSVSLPRVTSSLPTDNLIVDLQTTVSARQTLESQQAENLAVQKEFAILSADSKIYKLIGPVLLKQDKNEAVSSVKGRLEFIDKEIKRTETRIKELQDGSEKKRMEVMQLQQSVQIAPQG